ncbi:MAG: hypothetical protein ACYTXA_07180 [Nostoc sp.]
MKSRTTAQFRNLFVNLPQQVQQQAREAYQQFKQDPWHPSLRFKQVHPRAFDLIAKSRLKISG